MSWYNNLFGTNNPAKGAMPYLDQIPGQTNQYMQPYFDAGKSSIPKLQEQYDNILSNPGGAINKMGESFHESPGFKFAVQQALEAAGHANAAGGMAGTPQHQFDASQMVTGLANQDYDNYIKNTMGLYNEGLHGQQGMAQMGQQSGQSMADMISQVLAQKGNYAFQGQNLKNQSTQGLWGGLGALGGAYLGGPFGPWWNQNNNQNNNQNSGG